MVHADIQVHLQELDRILHRKVEGDADFPFGTLKSAAETPNRTGDEIVVFFFTHFLFSKKPLQQWGEVDWQKSLLYAMFLPGSVEKLLFTGFGTGGWVVECQKLFVFKEATTALAFTSFCLSFALFC